MDVRLLRALRFIRDFHRRLVLVHKNHPRLRRGPTALSGIFEHWPTVFLLYSAIWQHGISCSPFRESSFFFSVNRTRKVREVEAYLTEEIGTEIHVRTYRKISGLMALPYLSRVLFNVLRKRSRVRWLRIIRYAAGGCERHLISQAVAFLLAYIDMRDRFRESEPALVICISDLTARRIASACAANAEGIPVFYWQNHVNHSWQPPFKVNAAVVCGMKGYKHLTRALKTPGWIYFRSVVERIQRPAPIPSSPCRIGIALNNYVDLDTLAIRLEQLKAMFYSAELILRPHPNAKQAVINIAREQKIRIHRQSVENFAKSCDLIVAGNTTLQIEVAARGTAVAHVPGLDRMRYDLTGLVAAGCIYGVDNLEGLEIARINSFYADESWLSRASKTLDLPLPSSNYRYSTKGSLARILDLQG